MGRDGLWTDKHAPIFRRNTLPPSSLSLYILQTEVADCSEAFEHTATYKAAHHGHNILILHSENLRAHTVFH